MALGTRVLVAASISGALLLGCASGLTLHASGPGIRAGRRLQSVDLQHCIGFSEVGDGFCDDTNNIQECAYDGGDCCECDCVSTNDYVCGLDVGFTCRDPASECVSSDIVGPAPMPVEDAMRFGIVELFDEFSFDFSFDMGDTDGELVDARMRTTVTPYASAFDTRDSPPQGCSPDGCTADLTRDHDLSDMSRWSCKEDLIDDQCVIYYEFEEPQDIVQVNIKFYKGDERVRILKLVGNEGFYKIITSSGTDSGFETFELNTDETATLSMEALGNEGNEWISITEVEFMVR